MADDAQTAFETDMKAILSGEKQAPTKTLGHFAERFNKARAEQETLAEEMKKLDAQMVEGRTNFAKLTGYIEGLAVDLRQLWEEANAKDAAPDATKQA